MTSKVYREHKKSQTVPQKEKKTIFLRIDNFKVSQTTVRFINLKIPFLEIKHPQFTIKKYSLTDIGSSGKTTPSELVKEIYRIHLNDIKQTWQSYCRKYQEKLEKIFGKNKQNTPKQNIPAQPEKEPPEIRR